MQILCWLGQLFILVLVVRIVMSYFPLQYGGTADRIHRALRSVTDPVLDPVRKVVPRIGMFDISPVIVIIAIQVVLGTFIC